MYDKVIGWNIACGRSMKNLFFLHVARDAKRHLALPSVPNEIVLYLDVNIVNKKMAQIDRSFQI